MTAMVEKKAKGLNYTYIKFNSKRKEVRQWKPGEELERERKNMNKAAKAARFWSRKKQNSGNGQVVV